MRGALPIVLGFVLLAACAANTPAQELALDSIRACPPRAFYKVVRVTPDGAFTLGYDPGVPEVPRFFNECIRPYFAAQALRGIARPGPDAPAAQRQGYADLDECLQGGVVVKTFAGGPGSFLVVRPPVIRITTLNEDGTFRWDGDDWAGRRLTGCMRQKSAAIQPPASGAPTPSGAAGSLDGVYAGDVCLGPSPDGDPARCLRAQATVRDGKLVGGWPGREGVTVKLTGEVSTTGDVKIEWHSEHPDGSPFAQADLSGTIQNGRLEANGVFSNGRTVSIRWTLNVPGRGK